MDARLPPPGLPLKGAALPDPALAADPRRWHATRQAAEDFEAQFLSQMLSHMYEGIETDGPFGGGHGEEMFRTLLITEYGKQISRSGGLGIADAVHRKMLELQEV